MLCLTDLERDCNLSKKFNKYLNTKFKLKICSKNYARYTDKGKLFSSNNKTSLAILDISLPYLLFMRI